MEFEGLLGHINKKICEFGTRRTSQIGERDIARNLRLLKKELKTV